MNRFPRKDSACGSSSDHGIVPPGSHGYGAIFRCPVCQAEFVKIGLCCPECHAKLWEQ